MNPVDAPKLKDKLNQLKDWPLPVAQQEVWRMLDAGEFGEKRYYWDGTKMTKTSAFLCAEGAIQWLQDHHAKKQSPKREIRDLCFFGFGLLTSPFLYILWTFVRGI